MRSSRIRITQGSLKRQCSVALFTVKVTFDLKTREVEKTDVAKNVAKNLTERQQRIIALISENPQITRAEIAGAIGVATKTIERELTTLSNIVYYVGPKKGGHWEIIKD
jgi:ATP-dependent DNA helicase RecG